MQVKTVHFVLPLFGDRHLPLRCKAGRHLCNSLSHIVDLLCGLKSTVVYF